jgi:hypothetical protein
MSSWVTCCFKTCKNEVWLDPKHAKRLPSDRQTLVCGKHMPWNTKWGHWKNFGENWCQCCDFDADCIVKIQDGQLWVSGENLFRTIKTKNDLWIIQLNDCVLRYPVERNTEETLNYLCNEKAKPMPEFEIRGAL